MGNKLLNLFCIVVAWPCMLGALAQDGQTTANINSLGLSSDLTFNTSATNISTIAPINTSVFEAQGFSAGGWKKFLKVLQCMAMPISCPFDGLAQAQVASIGDDNDLNTSSSNISNIGIFNTSVVQDYGFSAGGKEAWRIVLCVIFPWTCPITGPHPKQVASIGDDNDLSLNTSALNVSNIATFNTSVFKDQGLSAGGGKEVWRKVLCALIPITCPIVDPHDLQVASISDDNDLGLNTSALSISKVAIFNTSVFKDQGFSAGGGKNGWRIALCAVLPIICPAVAPHRKVASIGDDNDLSLNLTKRDVTNITTADASATYGMMGHSRHRRARLDVGKIITCIFLWMTCRADMTKDSFVAQPQIAAVPQIDLIPAAPIDAVPDMDLTPAPAITIGKHQARDRLLQKHCAPGGNFDLTGWDLDTMKGDNGVAEVIHSAELQGCKGFHDNNFYISQHSGDLILHADGNPERAYFGCDLHPDSKHCRTQLTEINPKTGADAAWSPKGDNQLTVLMRMDVVGDSRYGDLLGEIIETGTEKPFAGIYYNMENDLYAGVHHVDGTKNMTKLGHIERNRMFVYELRYAQSLLTVVLKNQPTAEAPNPMRNVTELETYDYAPKSCHFRMGINNQAVRNMPSKVHISWFGVMHAGGSTDYSPYD